FVVNDTGRDRFPVRWTTDAPTSSLAQLDEAVEAPVPMEYRPTLPQRTVVEAPDWRAEVRGLLGLPEVVQLDQLAGDAQIGQPVDLAPRGELTIVPDDVDAALDAATRESITAAGHAIAEDFASPKIIGPQITAADVASLRRSAAR